MTQATIALSGRLGVQIWGRGVSSVWFPAAIAHLEVPMQYRAIINIDHTDASTNEQQRLAAALSAAGWKKVETSTYAIDTDNDLSRIWLGVELVAKQSADIGALSALTIHIQGSPDFAAGLALTTTFKPDNALTAIREKAFPAQK
jgi:hypothetical protein